MKSEVIGRIVDFCAQEVTRQGHDIFASGDGDVRLGWMLEAWKYALLFAHRGVHSPRLEDVCILGTLVERRNEWQWRQIGVNVGDYQAPHYTEVPQRLEFLWTFLPELQRRPGRARSNEPMTADDFYVEFELIHPFVDGNGRVGKILYNWLLGTLTAPVLVAPYFGIGHSP